MTQVRRGNDAWVNSAATSLNTGKNLRFRVQDGPPTKRAFVFIKNPVAQGGVVSDARLRIRGRGTSGTSATLTLQRCASNWRELQINYDNQPGVTGSTVTVTGTQSTDGQVWEFDVTALVQTMANQNRPFNVRIISDAATELQFYSFDSPAFRPVLDIDWSMPPEAPTELSPAGGSKVTLAKPKLLFNYTEITGDDEMLACQVQVNSTNTYVDEDTGFTAPDFDSGVFVTSDPELDLSDGSLSFGGITTGDSVWWAAKVESAAGDWSPWSRPVTFGRIARGSLAILSPTGGVVNDASQEIIWELTGTTQIAWSVDVWVDATSEIVHRTGVRKGADTSYTLPWGVIISESVTYRIRVRVWEDITRVTTPGDPVFTEAIETFVFAEDPTPDPFTDLVIDQLPPLLPVPRLNFQRATAPDFVSVWRDGGLVATDLDPADLAVSPGVYEYLDYSAEPRLSHTYKVRPKVDGKLGPGVTGTVTFQAPDVWLADDRTGSLLPLKNPGSGGDQIQFAAPQPGSSHMVKNGKHVQRVYQTQQGLQGNGKGLIIDAGGRTAADSVELAEYMRDNPELKFRLIVGNLNLTVVLGNWVISPYAYGGPNDSLVTFSFWSQSKDWT